MGPLGIVADPRAQDDGNCGAAMLANMAPAQLLFVATFHMSDVEPDLILGSESQRSLREVAEALAAFEPTKVAVEVEAAHAGTLQQGYHRWRAGEGTSPTNESAQLGFGLAQRCGLDGVHPVDVMWRFYEESVEALCARDEEHARRWQELLRLIETRVADLHRLLAAQPVREVLRHVNSRAFLDDLLAGYFRHLLPLADGDDAPGPKMIANWYERNVMIMRRIQVIAEPGDRIVSIYGTDHVPVLEHFARVMDDFEVVPAIALL